MEQEWISLNEFMKKNKMGYETAKKLIASGEIKYQKIGKQYKIKVSKEEAINEDFRKVLEENAMLKAFFKTIQNTANQVEI